MVKGAGMRSQSVTVRRFESCLLHSFFSPIFDLNAKSRNPENDFARSGIKDTHQHYVEGGHGRFMVANDMDFIGGGFKLTTPYTFWGWVVWVLGAVIIGFGVVTAGSEEWFVGLGIAAVGLLVLSGGTPGSLEKGLHKLRKGAMPPEELEAKAQESGLTVDNWFLQQTTLVPTNDPNDWILPAPGPQTWDTANPYGPHGDGSPLPEHPVKVGTPRPATMTSFGIFSNLAVVCGLVAGTAAINSDPTLEVGIVPALVVAGVGLIATLVSFFKIKALGQMLDTPTSLVRSAAVGHPELVGQVRPGMAGGLTVKVDGSDAMVMHNMTGFRWTYEQYQCRTVRDSEGNTREECNWVTIRSDKGGVPFILHDGTGGIKVNLTSFKRTDYGQLLKRWDGAFAQTLGKQLMASAVAGLLGGATVKKHRWTLYGLRLGDPVYVLGETKPRPSDELQAEGLDGTLGNSTIEVWGNQDAPGTKCTLMRGSELSNIGKSRSGLEMMLPALLIMLGGLAMIGLI